MDDPSEQVPCHLVGREPALPAEGAGDAVLVLEPEDASFHGSSVGPGSAKGWSLTRSAGQDRGDLVLRQAAELSSPRVRAIEHAGLDLLGLDLASLGGGEGLDGLAHRCG